MDFETMDWKAEAERVARAFGVEGKCFFRAEYEEYVLRSVDRANKDYFKQPLIQPRVYLLATYEAEGQYFEIYNPAAGQSTTIIIGDTIDLNRFSGDLFFANEMARALYKLDLLTPEIEAMLKVNISAHQRLEWALEFESRA